jgi:hypothetical protein
MKININQNSKFVSSKDCRAGFIYRKSGLYYLCYLPCGREEEALCYQYVFFVNVGSEENKEGTPMGAIYLKSENKQFEEIGEASIGII